MKVRSAGLTREEDRAKLIKDRAKMTVAGQKWMQGESGDGRAKVRSLYYARSHRTFDSQLTDLLPLVPHILDTFSVGHTFLCTAIIFAH